MNRKRSLSPEKTENCRAKKPNREGNPNLTPLGTRPPSSLSNNNGESTKSVETPPIISSGSNDALSPSQTHEVPFSYASITSGAPASNNCAVNQNTVSGPHEASASALAFEPNTVRLWDALFNFKDDKLGQVFDPLIKFIEKSTMIIDSQSEKIESLGSLVTKQAKELSFLRAKLLDIESKVKSNSDNADYHCLKSERSSVKEQFEDAQKIVRVVNIEKKGRPNKDIISDTIKALKAGTAVMPSFEEVGCFGNSVNDSCTVTLKCRSKEDRVSIEKRGKIAGLVTRHHVPKNFVKTPKDIRVAYLNNDFKGSINKSDRIIMVRTNQSVSGFQVHMKSKSEGGRWRVIEYINFPTSQNCLKALGGKQTLSSNLVNLGNVFIPPHF